MTSNVWETTIECAGRTVAVDLWFNDAPPDAAAQDRVARFTADADEFDRAARRAIREDPVLGEYLEHHVDDLGEEPSDEETFLRRLHLVRIGLYPGEPDRCACFDYTTGRDVTDCLVAVRFDARGAVTGLAMES
ncbi:DUF2004 domain-containing protein [Dactylosporangium salmoneum]|uniref:DUF2004 domain-containing protein n=1 Tax=Dactylosporangium salmoneum TaxID=53361 RepID=A0ABP5V836_9ACTN